MTTFRQNFRKWWQPPRKAGEREEERRVTFLELFYDLVYVVIVAQLAHALATNVTLAGLAGFAFLFVIVWWAWFNGASYHDFHGNNDIRTRVFTFLQMLTVAAMAVFAHDALGESSVGFALSYAAFQLILAYLWWRTGVHDPDHRPLSQPFALTFLLTALLFAGSVFVPTPLRFYLWSFAVLLSLLLPFYVFHRRINDETTHDQVEQVTRYNPSLVERFDLFTIVVLGEVVVGTINGVAGQHDLTWLVGVTAVLGMLIAIGLWWVYFDFVSSRLPQATVTKTFLWTYLHLPITAGIVATGAAVFNFVEHAGEPLEAGVQWLLVGSVTLVLLCDALLMQSIQIPQVQFELYRLGGLVTVVAAVLILLLGLLNLAVVPLLMLVVLLILIPIFYGITVWIKVFGAEEFE